MAEKTWTPSQIGTRIEQVVGERMANSFWVRGEVSDVSRTTSGVTFLSLIETDDAGRVVAKLATIMSPGKARLVDRRMERVGQPLTEGIEVRIRGHLEYYTPGGRLSLRLDDIDPAHTAGAMAVARRELLTALRNEGLDVANPSRPLTRVPLRIGLVTRGDSQAFHDLFDELSMSGLPFDVTLASASVQGLRAPDELTGALERLVEMGRVDLILLTRGGGAEVELATFDDPRVARAVAGCPIQVWTGIGHHLDVPVAEQIAARSFKTPTALAQGVIATVHDAITATEESWAGITATATSSLRRARGRLDLAGRRTQSARVGLRGAAGRLDAATHRLDTATSHALQQHRSRLDARHGRLGVLATSAVAQATTRLNGHEGLVDAYDPRRLLERGWSVTTTPDGRLVTDPLPTGHDLVTTIRGGTMTSKVT